MLFLTEIYGLILHLYKLAIENASKNSGALHIDFIYFRLLSEGTVQLCLTLFHPLFYFNKGGRKAELTKIKVLLSFMKIFREVA